MKFEHLIYGLKLSTDAPIPGLELVENPGECDVEVRFLEKAAPVFEERHFSRDLYYTDFRCGDGDPPQLLVWRTATGNSFRFACADNQEFVLDLGAGRIWARWPEPLTIEDTAACFLGPILGYWLRLQGIPCLHASAVAVEGRAIALLGPSGAGKSTTAAVFARRGHPVISDDVVALREQDGTFMVSPGYPLLRLWPETVRDLCGSADALPPLTPNWDKCYLDLTLLDGRFQREPLPLGAIYVLGERRSDLAAPVVESVPAASRLMTLVANTYTNYLLDQALRAQEFHSLSRLIERVPVRRVTRHADPTTLDRLCDVIIDDFRMLTPQPSCGSRP